MSKPYARQRIRLAFDVASTADAVDQLGSGTPHIWRGTDVSFELCAFYNGGPTATDSDVVDISNVASLTLEVKPLADRDGDAVMTKTITSADFFTITKTNWEQGFYQCAINFLNTETAPSIGTADSLDFWLVISVLTNDTPDRHITWTKTKLTIEEDGTGTGLSPTPGDPLYYTAAQTDAAIQAVKWDFIRVMCADTGKYHKAQFRKVNGVLMWVIGDEELT